jgi:hypothetical protein
VTGSNSEPDFSTQIQAEFQTADLERVLKHAEAPDFVGAKPPQNQVLKQTLEVELRQQIEAALQAPETANFASLYQLFDQLLAQQPLDMQLQVGGLVLLQLSELCVARANCLIADWETQHSPIEPLVDLESCLDLFVQSLSINISDLFEPDPMQYPSQRQQRHHLEEATGSTVEEVDKAALLDLADLVEVPLTDLDIADQIQHLAHDENVEQWSQAITEALRRQNSTVQLNELQQILKLPLVELWLGLLLGGYDLEQRGDFYDGQTIWVLPA